LWSTVIKEALLREKALVKIGYAAYSSKEYFGIFL